MNSTRSQPLFNPQQVFLSLITGLIVGISEISVCLSLAILVFSERLAGYVPSGFSAILLCGVIASGVVAVLSSSSNVVAVPQDVPIAILTVITTTILTQMPVEASDQELWLSVAAVLFLTTFLTGICCSVLGLLKFGNLTRFMPYPVVGGFLAGSGWLLIKGGIEMMSGVGLTGSHLLTLVEPSIFGHWFSGAVFGVVLFWLTRRYDHWSIVPSTLIAFIGLFYLAFWLTHTSLEQAREQGWLLQTLSQGVQLRLLNPLTLSQVNWSLIFQQAGNIASIVLLSIVGVLLSASGIELATKQDIDLNQELQAVGLANLLTSFSGGFISFHQLNYSILANDLKVNSRLVGIFTAIAYGIALLLGSSVIAIFPKPILGGMLVFLGLGLLVEWLYDAWFKLPKSDYLSVVLILLVIGTVGFLQGVAVGLVVTVILFVINYSRINVAKHHFSGVSRQSNVARSPAQTQLLQKQGERIYILELEGFIFFGTANNLLEQIQRRIESPLPSSLDFLVLDFRLVRGIDSSAVLSFAKLGQIAQKNTLTLVFTHLSTTIKKRLQRKVSINIDCQIFPDLDRGLEWCEEQLLQFYLHHIPETSNLEKQLSKLFLTSEQVPVFISYLEFLEVPEGQVIFEQGEASEGLYFLETGQISVFLRLSNGQSKRLRTYNSETILGEMGLYQNTHRSASVIADKSSHLYYLSNQAFARMEAENPTLALAFHRYIVILIAERLRYRETELRSLLE